MRFCYAFRRFGCYPQSLNVWDLHPDAFTDNFLGRVARMGFDGIEVGAEMLDRVGGGEREMKAFGRRLADAGAPIVSIRAGGSFIDPRRGKANRERQMRAVRYAGWLGGEVVNSAISSPPRYETHSAMTIGRTRSQDSSRDARISEYEAIAAAWREACDAGADQGVQLSVEVHQNSQVDNSWSALLLKELIGRENFGVNPDLGNIAWTYDVPEESYEDAIAAMAPAANYWHCKNLVRIHHPENQRTVFLRVPLPDGEIDYRFAIEAMHGAGYRGLTVIEGAMGGGDQWHADQRSLDYVKGIWAELEG
ncbi:MAG: sugar phosphate isomerase/epimerase [Gemmatimonadetes bacterium]|nr:sugar phosphate isomerase/epimerase [Gemmatimonadota bacterium]